MVRGGQTYYYHADALGTITHLANASGAVAQSYEYDGFGNIVSQNGTTVQPYTYTGREWDNETGLYYYRARYYDPQVGRFITEDPIGIGGGINYYTYVINDPMNFTDPFGLDKCCDYPDFKNAVKFYKKINKAIQAGKCGKAMDPIVRAWQECYKEFEQCKTLEDQLKFYDKYTDTAFVSFAVLGCVKKKSGDPKVFSKWFEACIKVAY